MASARVLINDEAFRMTLADTAAAGKLFQQLPLKLELDDFNQNEKVGSLGKKFPNDLFLHSPWTP